MLNVNVVVVEMNNKCKWHEKSGSIHPSLTEEIIQNYDALPDGMKGWRRFRIEYGFECSCPEGTIYLPPHLSHEQIEKIEELLQPDIEPDREFWDMS